MLNEISEKQLQHIKLWYLVQHSLPSYSKLIQYFGSAEKATQSEQLNRWVEVNIHKNHIARAQQFLEKKEQDKFLNCIQLIQQHCDFILIDDQDHYPTQLLPYTDRPPILFGKGQLQNLSQAQIAIVGSRKPSPHGKQVAYDFAYYLSEQGFYITSGLAEGIDEAAHMGALKNNRTIAVVGTGLDQIYPSQNRHLQQQILDHAGTVISEFLPTTKPLQHHFPRRNRIVSALSLGIVVAEAKINSGSLITAQAAANQGKTTFAIPGHIYSEHHQGCHQLIREGAILVDHPEQIIEDLALATQWQYQNKADLSHSEILSNDVLTQPTPLTELNIPDHLYKIYQQLDWVGQDLDILAQSLSLDAASLTSALMELELMGHVIQQSGLYLRCRNRH